MADSFQGFGSVKVTSGIKTDTTPLNFNISLSGSRHTDTIYGIPSSSAWTPLSTGSLASITAMLFVNLGSTGSIQIATDATGSNIITKLSSGGFSVPSVIAWNGTASLYCKCFNGTGSLQYDLVS